ncbi:MAG: TadE family type IV pilus minor pilin [Kibdelosporangium sp.]
MAQRADQEGDDDDLTSDRGAVTVEAAIALGALVLAMWLVVAGISTVTAHLRCVDAAREAARLVARGDADLAEEAARRIAPADASLEISVDGERISVTVSAGLLVTVSGEAFAVAEPQDSE